MKQDKNYLGRIKESVDFIYALVTENPDGYQGGFDTFTPTIIRRVASNLVKRGILVHSIKSRGKGKKGVMHFYKWGSDMEPTNVLYKSIMAELRELKAKERFHPETKNVLPLNASIAEDGNRIPSVEKKEYVTALDGFSAQELWDELKRRGISIEGDRLVIVKKAYLD